MPSYFNNLNGKYFNNLKTVNTLTYSFKMLKHFSFRVSSLSYNPWLAKHIDF